MKKYIFTEGKGTYGSNAKSTTSDSFVMIEDTSFLEGFTLPWNSITNKPTAFPPTAHEHSASEITSGTLSYARLPFSSTNVNNWNTAYSWGNHANQGYLKTVSWGIITGKPTSFPPSSHTHTWSEITGKPTFAPSDAEKNVQSNWNETNTNSDAFIRNKPNLNFLPLAGGAFDTDSQLTFPTGNTDLDFLRVRYNNGDTLGFFWRYTGTQTGNENGLELHTSTNLAYRLTQDGVFNFNKTPYVNTNQIYHEGNLTKLSQLNNDLNFISEVSWNNVLNKPTTFPPSSHTHPISQITNLQTTLNRVVQGDNNTRTSLGPNRDADDYFQSGFYYPDQNTTLPNQGALIHANGYFSNNVGFQLYSRHSVTNDLQFRNKTNGTWNPAETIYHTGNLTKLSQLENDEGYLIPDEYFKAEDVDSLLERGTYREAVLLILPYVDQNQQYNNFISGHLTFRKQGGNMLETFHIVGNNVWSSNKVSYTHHGFRKNHKLVTCLYNGVKWVALKFEYQSNDFNRFEFYGNYAPSSTLDIHNDGLKYINYYDVRDEEILIQEIYDSIEDFSSEGYINHFDYLGYSIYHEGNLTNLSQLNNDLNFISEVSWNNVLNKPSTFPPSSHTHPISQITNLQTALDGKSDINHTHSWSQITSKPSTFTPSAHTHPISQITNLQSTLNNKANTSDLPTKVSQLENDSGYSSRNLAIGASLKSGWGVYAGPNNVLQIIDNLPTPIVRVDNIVGGRVGVHIVDPYRLMELENGERYTIQFEARGNCNLNYIYLMSVSDANQSLPVGGVVREEWETFKATFTKSSNINSQYYYLMFSTSSDSVEGEWFELKNVKMVKGESDIQSYSPAPEDKAGIDHKHIWNDISDNTTNSAGGLRHTTQYGYIDFGPLNSSYGHIHTDRPNFYFNKPLYSIGEKIATEPWANSKFLTTETDPTVPSHVKSITTTEKSNWNTAYNWGNHANAGYALASRTITAGTGLTGGGSLAGNRTINFDTTWGDNRYALQNGNYASLRARGTTKADVGLGNVPNWSGSTSTSLGTSNTVIPSQGAVKAYVDNVRSQILGGSPAALDTLYELAAALGNDPNFSTTVMNEIGTKVPQTRTITAGTGLTGGGNLTANRTISFDTTWGDSRYAGKSHTHSISDITNLQSTLNNKANTSDLPTKVSELENDSPNNIDFVNLGSTTTLYARSEYYSGKLRMATSGGSTTVIDDTENGASLGFVNKFSRGWTSNINLNASAGIFQGTYDLYIRARGSTSLPWGIYNSTKAATHNIDFRPTSAVPLTEEYQEHYMGRVTFSSEDIRDRVYTWFSSSGYDDDEFFVDYVKIVPVPEFNHKVTVDGNEVYHPGNLNPVTLDTPQTLTEGKKIHKLVDGGVFNALELRNPSYGNANSSSVELNIGVSNSSVKERLAGIAAYGIGSYGDTVRLSLGVRNRETELPETLTVNRNGNVGIDKTTPAEKLDVGGNIRASGTILADTDKEVWHKGNLNPVTTSRTITAGTGLSGGGNLGANRTISFDTSWGDGRYVGKSGDTMTGTLEVISNTTHTSPDTLNPNGASIRLFNDLTTDNAGEGPYITFENRYLGSGRTTRAAIKGGTSISGNTANGFIAFYTDSSTANSMDERMRIDHAGNVGIGTASPTQKLDVNGIIKATGGNSTQWNTAYGWGNHATQGYLKSYTDTKYSAGTGLSLSGTTFNITNPFNPSGTYSGLRAQATTKADVGLSNVDNWTSHVTATCDGGWVTLLEMSASRRYVEMQIFDAQSGRHNMSHLLVTRTYGGLSVNVLSSNGHSNRYQEFRILQESGDKIYGNAILQVRLSSSAELRVRTKETGSISGWNNTPPITPFNEDIRTGYSVIETISNIDSSAGSMGTTGVLSAGRGIFTGGNIEAEGNITTSGFSRVGSSNSYVLLGGGSHKSLSDFAMASGTYSGLRAQATTKADVGLGSVDNYSRAHYDSRYLRISGNQTISGLKTFDNGTNTTVRIISDDGGVSKLELYGANQGTGYVYVGQSQTHGGGIEYSGDNNPVTSNSGSDYVTLFRRTGGVDHWTARNFHSNNDWEFRGHIDALGFSKQGSSSSYVLTGDGGHKAISDFVQTGRTITAGTGLTGGGSFSSNRTISFDTNWGDNRYARKTHQHAQGDIDFKSGYADGDIKDSNEWASGITLSEVGGNNTTYPYGYGLLLNVKSSVHRHFQVYARHSGVNEFWVRTLYLEGGTDWAKLWHDGNLNPMTTNTNQTITGTKTFEKRLTISNSQYQNHLRLIRGDIEFQLAPSTANSGELRFLATNATQYIFDKKVYVEGDVHATGDVISDGESSDRRLKDNIKAIPDALNKLSKIGGYTFDWNDKQDRYKGRDVGVIAQEVKEVLPEIVTEREDGYNAVKYEKIVPLLIEANKELHAKVKDQDQKIASLEERLSKLEKLLL